MTSINNSYNNQYYQLASQQQNTQTTNTSAAAPKSLADVLAASDDTTTDNSNNAYLLDLSPQAQAYMNSNANAATGTSSASFTLTDAQQKSLDAIITKYKDLPQTQDNFEKIQDDLNKAGLSPDLLKAQDQVKTFNSTATLISALAGTSSDIATTQTATASDEDTKASNFMQQVISAWKKEASDDGA